ncbi:MAG TPA: hypothetical protein VKB41_02740 [Steroidobacteraceae bacterium]|nr:hypothetical protein [Steroidobacteraceae bacterium]
MHSRYGGLALIAVAALANATAACAQSNEEMNKANNPLTPTLAVNFQDQYIDSYYGLDGADSNALLLRGATPHKLFGKPQLLRATLPIVTTPDLPPSGDHTDIGDLNLFDVFLLQRGHLELGFGPQLTIPTAGRDETGTGKWQAGLAALAMAPLSWGMIGGLVTWQASFAGDDDRRNQNNLLAQPFFIYNLPKGWYLRSSATWTWDLELDTYYIPIGAGAGKVWKVGTTVFNAFVEPQWTVAHHGDGVPEFQVFFGLNLQFPL